VLGRKPHQLVLQVMERVGVCRECAMAPTRVSSRGEWVRIPSVTQIASGRVVVGRQSLPLTFRTREVVLMDVERGQWRVRSWVTS